MRLIPAVSLALLLTTGPGDAQTKPLPIVQRSDNGTTPFDQPPLIVLGSMFEQRTTAIRKPALDGVGDAGDPPAFERLDRLSLLVLRVNERLSSDPDLGGR